MPKVDIIKPADDGDGISAIYVDGDDILVYELTEGTVSAVREALLDSATTFYIVLASNNWPMYVTFQRDLAVKYVESLTPQFVRDFAATDDPTLRLLDLVGGSVEVLHTFPVYPLTTEYVRPPDSLLDTGRRRVEINKDGGFRVVSPDRNDRVCGGMDIQNSPEGLGALRDLINQYLSEN